MPRSTDRDRNPVRFFFEANRIKQLESTQAEGTVLRLWREGRPGLAVAYGDSDPKILVERAIALSDLNPPEAIELAEARQEIRALTGDAIAVDRLVEAGREAIARTREFCPDAICNAEFSCEQETTILTNSLGFYGEYSQNTLSYYLGVEWIRGEDFLAVYDGETSHGDMNPAAVLDRLCQRLQWAKENVDPPLGRVPVILTPNAASLLWDTVVAAMDGRRAIEQSSPWSDRVGEVVAATDLTLSQHPDRPPYDCPFDDEGTPTRSLSLIENGCLVQFYCDRATGRLLGTGSTGNGFRPGLGSYPVPSPINAIIEPRSGSLADFIRQLDSGLVIDQILGGGADISGDFSVNVDLGYRVADGEIVGRVKDTMVAGNVYTALQELIGIGCDRRWSDAYFTPSVLLAGLSVVG